MNKVSFRLALLLLLIVSMPAVADDGKNVRQSRFEVSAGIWMTEFGTLSVGWFPLDSVEIQAGLSETGIDPTGAFDPEFVGHVTLVWLLVDSSVTPIVSARASFGEYHLGAALSAGLGLDLQLFGHLVLRLLLEPTFYNYDPINRSFGFLPLGAWLDASAGVRF